MGRPAPTGGLAELRDEIVAHSGCGYEPCETATRTVPGEGNPEAAVVFVGEAPGRSEDELGRPFVGRAGKLLDELLAEAGVVRGDVWITNVVKARPPKNRDPKAPEIAHWMPVLEREIELIRPRLIVPLGRHALKHFAPAAKIGDVHGTLLCRQGRPSGGSGPRAGERLFPLYHPAAAMYNQTLKATLFEDARALGALLSR